MAGTHCAALELARREPYQRKNQSLSTALKFGIKRQTARAGVMCTCTPSNTIRRSGIRRNDMCLKDFKRLPCSK